MAKRTHLFLTISILMLTMIGSGLWFMNPPVITSGSSITNDNTNNTSTLNTEEPSPGHAVSLEGKNVVIYLHTMSLELRDGETILETLPLLSQGRPGSYYETIGGSYTNDYKTPLHFSSIGHVYMPYSVHLFGNYFIHGVPYYPSGEPVSSTYSGGCIRLTDENAKRVYDFIERGTPIIITRESASSFSPTKKTTSTLPSIQMTNSMVATISLELLTQDNVIRDVDSISTTTRKTLLPRLLKEGDTAVSHLYADSIGKSAFIDAMNKKAESLGLSNTHFTSVDQPVETTYEDYMRFMTYINTYKSYLRMVDGK